MVDNVKIGWRDYSINLTDPSSTLMTEGIECYGYIDHLLILKAARNCAKQLNIKCPKISLGESPRDFNLALLVLNKNNNPEEITLAKGYKIIQDALFAVCHEMRHAYQIVLTPELFDDYKEIGSLELESYNLQAVEIDAIAFT